MAKLAVYFAVLVAVALIAGSNGKSLQSCPRNQMWTNCPSACPKFCGKPIFAVCSANCEWPPRCVCKKDQGYVKSGNDCVLTRDCPQTDE